MKRKPLIVVLTCIECVLGACTSVSDQIDAGGDAGADATLDVSFPATDAHDEDGSMCDAGLTRCGTACVDLLTDDLNCGTCGQACQASAPSTATCTGGRCLVVLASGQGGASALFVDSSNVYFTTCTTGGGVMRVPIGGGNVTTIAPNQNAPMGLAIANGVAYWTNFGSGDVMTMPLDGGTPFQLATGQKSPVGVAVTSTNVYWTVYKGAAVMSAGLDGGTPMQLAFDQTAAFDPDDIVVDSNYVYWSIDQGSPPYTAIMRSPLDGGGVDASTPMTPGLSTAQTLAIEGAYIYFNSNVPGVGIARSPLGGGAATPLIPAADTAGGIAIDSINLYAIANGLVRVPLGGGTVTTLYDAGAGGGGSDPQRPHTIAVDSTSVYWTDFGTGTVMKLTPK